MINGCYIYIVMIVKKILNLKIKDINLKLKQIMISVNNVLLNIIINNNFFNLLIKLTKMLGINIYLVIVVVLNLFGG